MQAKRENLDVECRRDEHSASDGRGVMQARLARTGASSAVVKVEANGGEGETLEVPVGAIPAMSWERRGGLD